MPSVRGSADGLGAPRLADGTAGATLPTIMPRESTEPAAETLACDPLPYTTPAAWAASQVGHIADLLIDQAHLEKKAAAAAMSFLFRIPLRSELLRGISALAREELVHFERTLKLLGARGIEYRAQPPSAYAERLKAGTLRTMPERLADELLVGAIIEARSCERMSLLAAALATVDPEVADFYADLVTAEERHEVLYKDAAVLVLGAETAASRWRVLGQHEAKVLRELPWTPRLHGGVNLDSPGNFA
ncbi:MAG: tRNA-(ms[2]io[6]A)-hydroxylase [Planctomycetes bacterium]|nr:tRNA-(ms[2]io[6]A)-hydroxylase [Planctomycetota bacterium]